MGFLFFASLIAAFGGVTWTWIFVVVFGFAWIDKQAKKQQAKETEKDKKEQVTPQEMVERLKGQAAGGDGNPTAAFQLGRMYDEGTIVSQDYAEARQWYELATEKGHSGAQICLGDMYRKGNGISVDQHKAFALYRCAADKGDSTAQLKLAELYESGQGTEIDIDEAVRLLTLATNDSKSNEAPLALKRLLVEPSDTDSQWLERLRNICSSVSGADYFVSELIPEAKLVNAWKNYQLPAGRHVVALIDCTIFGSATDGMLIGESGISWHNMSISKKIQWSELSVAKIKEKDANEIEIGPHGCFSKIGSSFEQVKLIALLTELREAYFRCQVGDKAIVRDKHNGKIGAKNSVVAVNSASFENLIDLPGIGAAEANLLIQYRDRNGRISSVEEITDLLSLKPHLVDRIRLRISFEDNAAASESRSRSHRSEPREKNSTAGGRQID